MGMYDELRCSWPLPVEGANSLLYQTKDTPNQLLDLYEIREDGRLWVQAYDVEDQSDPNATGIMRLCGCMARVNERWIPVEHFTGEICFYSFMEEETHTGWIEFSAYFEESLLVRLNLLEKTNPTTISFV